jgi:methylmalonyl-CoA mutase, N-terminal domain
VSRPPGASNEEDRTLSERKPVSRTAAGWEAETYGPSVKRAPERSVRFESLSGIPIRPLYTHDDLAGWSYADKLGYPGEFPFTRGPYPSMYRGRLWTMRMFAGFGRPEDTNARFKYLLEQGQTGLSTAFDMPALMGYDADHPRARGEVGKEGVSVSTLADFETLFRDIPLDQVTTSMTINCTASVALAMYLALADKQGVSWDRVGGTMQNDMLKEFIAQKEWISPPESAVRLVVDTIEFCAKHVPRFNPVSISGYHIREAGSTAVQELAFTLADGFGYVEACVKRGLAVDSFASRLSFFFDIHNDFFEEIAKLRAARRIWATVMRDRFGAREPESMRLRTHTQTAGVSATAQQPLNNVARVAIQALAAVLGGAQSLHTNSYDEVLALPTEQAVTVALRTQQIIADETGVPLTIDPLGGSYFLETLTDQMQAQAMAYIRRIDELGGIVRAIDTGYPQREIADAAYRYQLMDDRGDKTVVGVNKYAMAEAGPVEYLRIDEAIEPEQIERVTRVKASRDAARVERRLRQLTEACRNGGNVMPVLVDAVKDYVSLGEISDVYRRVFGLYREPIIF